jgi:hypothetical protein
MPSDGPFGSAPDVGVGFSDGALLVVSGIGFLVLSVTLYSIVITKLKSADEIEEEEKDLNYDEKLANADVSTLTRAQRRARARYIMKQQRRVAPIAGAGAEGAGNENEDDAGDDHIEELEGDDHDAANRNLSRKERQKAAKLAEREERKLFEEDRRKQQLEAQAVAQKEKQQREKLEAQKAEEERILKQKQKEDQEARDYEKWKTFLKSDDDDGSGESITVKDWIKEMKTNRIESIESIAERFGKSMDTVRGRIQQLIETDRISGILEKDHFVYLSDEELKSIAASVKSRDQTSDRDMSSIIQKVISS